MKKLNLLIFVLFLSIAVILLSIQQLRINDYKIKYDLLLEENEKIREGFKDLPLRGNDINDHAFCGDNLCKGYYIDVENTENCPKDCFCGDSVCDEIEEVFQTCLEDCPLP